MLNILDIKRVREMKSQKKHSIFLCFFIFFHIIARTYSIKMRAKPLYRPIFLRFSSWLSHLLKKPPRYKLENATVNGSSSRLEKFLTVFLFSTMQKEMLSDFLTLLLLLLENTRDEKSTLLIRQRKLPPFVHSSRKNFVLRA